MMFLPMLMNPWVILTVIVALSGTFGWGHHVGWNSRDRDAQIEVAKANDAARVKEQTMTVTINEQANLLRKANDEITAKQTDITRLNAAGRLRLPAPRCVQAAASSAAPAGDRDQGPSELERQTIEALIAIAADGDRAAAQANACIDSYNKMKDLLNGDS